MSVVQDMFFHSCNDVLIRAQNLVTVFLHDKLIIKVLIEDINVFVASFVRRVLFFLFMKVFLYI